jgi:membrane-associated phospholipid phosphatase
MPKISLAKVDLFIFNVLYSYSGRYKTLDSFAVFCATILPLLLVVFLFILSWLYGNWPMFFIPFIAALFARFVVNEMIYYFYQRKRPLEVLSITALVDPPDYPSFPSGHAAAFFALSFTILPFNFILAIIFLVSSFLIAIGRIFCGLHWPTDIVAGVISGWLGFFVTYIVLMYV